MVASPPKWIALAQTAPVFSGFSASEIERVARCLGVHVRRFDRGDDLLAGSIDATSVGLVLDGSAFTARVDARGTRQLVDAVAPGDVFGEGLLGDAASRGEITVTGANPGHVAIIGMDKIVNAPEAVCHLRARVVENLFHVMAAKNRSLQQKLVVIATKSLRERILLFLAGQAGMHGSRQFTIMFSRTELADYLNADRTALSRELTRMKNENLIDYYRDSFTVLQAA